MNGSNLQFKCRECDSPVSFSVLNHPELSTSIECSECHKKYVLGNTLLEQLKQFEALCRQIRQSKEIFGKAAISISVGPHQVKIPFQLLLTRLSSVLELMIGEEKTTFAFRVDTLRDLPSDEEELSPLLQPHHRSKESDT